MRQYLILGSVLVVGLWAAPSVWACSCVPNPPPREALDQAAVVFAGRVLEIRQINDDEGFPLLDVTLWVEQSFKGFFIETVNVFTARDSATCGFPFQKDERYLIYAHEDEDGTLHVSLCSRTARIQDAREDLLVFDALDLLNDPEEEDDDGGGGLCGGLTNVASMQAMFFVFLIVALQRRRRKYDTRA